MAQRYFKKIASSIDSREDALRFLPAGRHGAPCVLAMTKVALFFLVFSLQLASISTFSVSADPVENATETLLPAYESRSGTETEANGTHEASPEPKTLSPESLELLRQNLIIKKLRDRLNFSSGYYKTLESEIGETQERLQGVKETIDTLEKQIADLSRQIRLSEQKISSLATKVAYAEIRIKRLYEDIEVKQIEMDENRKYLQEYLRLRYMQELTFDEKEGHSLNIVKFLLSDNSLSELAQREAYLELFEHKEQEVILALNKTQRVLAVEKKDLSEEREKHAVMKESLEDNKTNLEAQKLGKQRLLQETQGKEEIYQQLLAESLEQQEEIATEIQLLRGNISFFNSRLGALKDTITSEEYEQILRIKEDAVGTSEALKGGSLMTFEIWPVAPRLGLSAYFTDANYKRVFGVDHGAVDIPVSQGTPVMAVENGVVVKVRDLDTGYNYVVIAHEKGVMTLYGHLTEIIVDTGDFVRLGDVIGLSGGVPGTRGAGLRTTGAHLHFEVFQDGVRVDPLDGYLPMDALSDEDIPERYNKTLDFDSNAGKITREKMP